MNINQNRNNVNFTSIIPLEVVVDGSRYVNHEIMENAVHNLSKMIAKPAKYKGNAYELLDEFVKHDRAFTDFDGRKRFAVPIKYVVDRLFDGAPYLFTDVHAQTINDLGKKLGIIKAVKRREEIDKLPAGTLEFENIKELIECKVKNSPSVKAAATAYGNKIKEYLSPEFYKVKVREFIHNNGRTRAYEGEPVTLQIFASNAGKTIEKVKFVRTSQLEAERNQYAVPVMPQTSFPKQLPFKEPEALNSKPKNSSINKQLEFDF